MAENIGHLKTRMPKLIGFWSEVSKISTTINAYLHHRFCFWVQFHWLRFLPPNSMTLFDHLVRYSTSVHHSLVLKVRYAHKKTQLLMSWLEFSTLIIANNKKSWWLSNEHTWLTFSFACLVIEKVVGVSATTTEDEWLARIGSPAVIKPNLLLTTLGKKEKK